METVFYTRDEVAAILKSSVDTVTRRFANLPGVVDIGTKEHRRTRRRRALRIPQYVLDRYLIDHGGKKAA